MGEAGGARAVVSVLGPAQVTVEGVVRPIRSIRQRRLVAALALAGPAGATADRLIDAVWPEGLPSDPRGALANQVARLRSAMADPSLVETVTNGYRLADGVEVDAVAFARAAARARLDHEGDTYKAVLHDCLAQWRGVPYEELDGDAATSEAARLVEMRVSAEEDLLELATDDGARTALAGLEALCTAHPLRERPRLLLARALVRTGQRPRALRVLDDYRRLVATELGIEPSRELTHAYDELLREPRPEPPSPGRVPRVVASVFGRDDDIEAVRARLRESSLVTLIGPGGVGKTTLALLVAARAEDFPDGVWYVDLVDVDDDAAGAAAFMRALGIDVPDPSALTSRVTAVLAGQRALVVIDNADSRIEFAATVTTAMLQASPVSVLATSREPLAIGGERLWPVEPLSTLEPDGPAVELFVERATSLLPSFRPTGDDLRTIGRLCTRLDGLPLAIELAAAQLRVRSLAELDRDFDVPFPSVDAPSPLSRHRGLAATLDSSYRTLAPTEQYVFDRLSVFPSGFTRRTVRRACSDVAPPVAVDSALDALIHKSLVRAEPATTETRYAMLETLRRYGRAHLAATGHLHAARTAHLGAITALVDEADATLGGPDEGATVAALDNERAEIAAAHRDALDLDVEQAIRLVRSLYFYAFPRGRDDIRDLAVATIGALTPSTRASPDAIAAVYGTAADHVLARGDVDRATSLALHGLSRRPDDPYCLGVAGDLALFAGRLNDARTSYLAAAQGHRRAERAALAAWVSAAAALPDIYAERRSDGLALATAAHDAARGTGCPSAIAFSRYVLAEAIAGIDDDDAYAHLTAAIDDATEVSATYVAGLAHLSLATMAVRLGHHADAVAHYAVLLDMWRKAGNWVQQWTTLRTLVVALAALGDHAGAVTLLAGIDANAPTPNWGADANDIAAATRRCELALGADAFHAAESTGRQLTGIEVLNHAESALRQFTS